MAKLLVREVAVASNAGNFRGDGAPSGRDCRPSGEEDGEMVMEGLITVHDVEVIKYTHNGAVPKEGERR